MKTYYDCLSCFVRQIVSAGEFVTSDATLREKMLRECFLALAEADFNQTPPEIAAMLYKRVNRVAGTDDPYKDVKDKFNHFALNLYPLIKSTISTSPDKFQTAIKLAIAGNIIDFGIHGDVDEMTVRKSVGHALEMELDSKRLEQFREDIESAKKILYLGDNCGEIVFDKAFIEYLGPERITFAVRSKPIINDITLEDAKAVGICDIVKVVENGWDGPGTALDKCSESFKKIFWDADVVISKGQGNYETLSHIQKKIYFMLKVKCPVVSESLGEPLGSVVLEKVFNE